jgi:hypothetical protein
MPVNLQLSSPREPDRDVGPLEVMAHDIVHVTVQLSISAPMALQRDASYTTHVHPEA